MLATTRAAILRGGTTDALGDEVDTNGTPVAGLADFPASITERSRNVQDPSSGMWRTIRYYSGRVPVKVKRALEPGDRLRDNRTELVYSIEEDELTARSISGRSSATLDLKLTGE